MKSQNFEDFISRTKQLMQQSNLDTPLKPNVSETIEKTVSGSDGKTYAIVRENKKFYIKESTDGSSFNYIGGSANKRDFEYQSYNAASKNLELKMRSINEAVNNNGVFETFEKPTQAEYMVEATEDMRGEIDRFRQIVNGVNCIMNESKVEFVSKPKIKDTETEKNASDPKKQGAPFIDIAKATLDKDQITKNIKPEDADTPFDCKPKSNLNDGKCVNSKKNKSVIVTEKQMEMIQKKINEGLYDDDFETYDDDDDEYDLLKKFDYPEINKLGKTYTPTKIDLEDLPSDDDDEEVYDKAEEDDDMVDEGIFDTVKAVGSVGRQFGKTLKNAASNVGKQVSQTYNKSLAQSSQAEIDKIANKLKNELITLNDRTVKSGGEPLNYNSVVVALSNKLRGQLGRQSFESNNQKKIYDMIDKVVNEVISEKKK